MKINVGNMMKWVFVVQNKKNGYFQYVGEIIYKLVELQKRQNKHSIEEVDKIFFAVFNSFKEYFENLIEESFDIKDEKTALKYGAMMADDWYEGNIEYMNKQEKAIKTLLNEKIISEEQYNAFINLFNEDIFKMMLAIQGELIDEYNKIMKVG